MMGNYGVPPLALARGEGSHVWDADGNRYLDLIAGIAVSALGHAHPAIVSAVSDQAKIAHKATCSSTSRACSWPRSCASLLHAEARVFFCNSGTEANEAALKLVRRKQGKGRPVSSPPTTASTAGPWALSPSPGRSPSGRRSSRSASKSAGSVRRR